MAALGVPVFTAGPLKTVGTAPVTAGLTLLGGRSYLMEVSERGIDVVAEVLDAQSQVMARTDHPERRSATQRLVLNAPDAAPVSVRISSQDEANTSGIVYVRAFDLSALSSRPECLAAMTSLAKADEDYAAGQSIARGRVGSSTRSARDTLLQAANAYMGAERALGATADRKLRGQTQLALAGIDYFDLQDWAAASDWAKAAAETLESADPYRQARAEAIEAASWIELGSAAPSGQTVPGYGMRAGELLARARSTLQQLARFHLQRNEQYDAGLQLTNIGLTYLYQSRFAECVHALDESARVFGSVHEERRRALSWQNKALCLWGLGRLSDAQRWFERALADITPEPYPWIYLGTVTNTALMDYALGHFDESLHLYDGALALAQRVQAKRDEAHCLYGIGVNYDALGDYDPARRFLESALAIQTVSLDGRGRMSSLRALAAVDAKQGRLVEAMDLDRQALGLAVGRTARERITIQLAAHAAAAGKPDQALVLLDEMLASGEGSDPLIGAEVLLQRAAVLRQLGRPGDALKDLKAAVPRLRSLNEEFDADLEEARDLRLLGRVRAALAATDRALARTDALRVQTSNPDLRADLQTPLRAAYDLKIQLLRAQFDDATAAGLVTEAAVLATAAFVTADASRAHTFADVAAQEYPSEVRQALAGEFRRREELYRQLAARRFALEQFIDRTGSEDARARHLLGDIAELERQADQINTLIARSTLVRRVTVDHARLPRIPAGTVLISYWLGSESAYAWVVSTGGVRWFRLAPAQEIADRARAFQRSLSRLVDVSVERRMQDAGGLYELIIRPLNPLVSDARQWVVIPDGALDYVPFAALRAGDGTSFVASQHDVATTPAAWMLRETQRDPPRWDRELLMVADPVYQADDPRLDASRSAGVTPKAPSRGDDPAHVDLQRLPYTSREAAGIAAQFPPKQVDELLGLDATRDRVLALDWSKYRFIHIATHGTVDAQVPELSALMLGSYDARGHPVDGAVRVADLSLRRLTAEVAVFSACDTALGKQVASEGLVGIGSTVLARGAQAVVSSLWPVSDEIGARLMTDFYRNLLQNSMSAPMALGAAMRSVITRDPSADPALWGAFQISVASLNPGLSVP